MNDFYIKHAIERNFILEKWQLLTQSEINSGAKK